MASAYESPAQSQIQPVLDGLQRVLETVLDGRVNNRQGLTASKANQTSSRPVVMAAGHAGTLPPTLTGPGTAASHPKVQVAASGW